MFKMIAENFGFNHVSKLLKKFKFSQCLVEQWMF